ncbi:MAG TPA: hypothetical protein PLF50_06410 [Candidatus Cloacimonadota bacterium]|nr:hypothetical protein [Candidatus Cloacimonadota bacterium]HOV17103.1 hypothetical protein [Candidatus Cloacimonadota bacterium]HQL15356.1 hypothetical protein [Candidatus Cloacimonadota bacterium]
MRSKIYGFFICLLLLLSAGALFAQNNKQLPDETEQIKSQAMTLLNQLLKSDWKAADLILWEDFTLNDQYLGNAYVDAFEAYEEDYFINDTLKQISKLLHSDGDGKDTFQNWKVKVGDKIITVSANNKKKAVTMEFKNNPSSGLILYRLKISNK